MVCSPGVAVAVFLGVVLGVFIGMLLLAALHCARKRYTVATFALSQSGTRVRGYHPRSIFGIPYAIWCIFRQSGGSYL